MFKSLYTRIAVYTIVILLLSAVASFILTNVLYHVALKPSNDHKIMTTLQEAKKYQKESHTTNMKAYFKHLSELNFQLVTVDQKGHKTFYGASFRRDTLTQETIDSVLKGHNYHGIKNHPYQLFVTGFFDNETNNTVGTRFKTPEGNVAVFMRPDIGKSFSEFRVFLAVLIVLLLIIAMVLIISSTYTLIKPITQLKNATNRLMEGDFSTPIETTRHDELGTLQYRFEQMRVSLKQLDDMRQHFVQNVSHEIKTPLTHIHQLLDRLSQAKDDETRQYYIDEIHATTNRLSNLTRALLLLAELDNNDHLDYDDDVEITQMLRLMVRHEQYAIDAKDLLIMTDLEPITVKGNYRLLYQAFHNILTNAIKYTKQEGSIDIDVFSENNTTMICRITDDGPGMSEDVQAHLFERFYKGNSSATSNGLGLAIAQMIMRLHGGDIKVESTLGEGSTFILSMPLSQADNTPTLEPLNQ
ncbi:HAMP domain-containing sensor histidine kinase [Staphylococcus simulans]|uniref:sensor histidine kinase n=1 Tax=Staphylococcus simulans TaxID=1286 RepID=UPI0027F23008|nr:HAMP domain-containing sensor histidine kinase [Staphylococcus simulans]MDQ7112979.1 HAMP domain-containing sensor histidine kinase [Staphylococcus simulans]MDQ7118594.1 HAMP domain-containing sensor histidine kinase [Staphylococcus simulans]WMM10783.1 HAMP domain-containing sensor histidine kinase [Staphylococcus simulans]